jgi:hypothetical protein
MGLRVRVRPSAAVHGCVRPCGATAVLARRILSRRMGARGCALVSVRVCVCACVCLCLCHVSE